MSCLSVVVTGGRDFSDRAELWNALRVLNPEYLFVGDCPTGADLYAREVAKERNMLFKVFEADWNKLGRAAGPIRNREMLKAAGSDALVLAFPGGAGTADCMRTAKALGMVVVRWQP